jgi:hypothetical protein
MERFQVLTAASMEMTVCWDAALCNMVSVYRRFRGDCCLYHQGHERTHLDDRENKDILESETWINF